MPSNSTPDPTASASTVGKAKNVIIFVADGLRPDSVNPTDAPTLYKLRQDGVNFINSHSLFPTFTTPNASAIATGHYLGDTGDFSNTIYTGFPTLNAGGSVTPFIENDAVLADIDEKFPGNNFLNEESLLAAARQAGFNTAAVGKLGPVLLQDVTQGNRVNGTVPAPQTIIIDDRTGQAGGIPLNATITGALTAAGLPVVAPGRGANGTSGNNTTPGTLVPNADQQQYFADATTKAILPLFKQDGKPFSLVYWSRDPDGTQHNQGDSLNSLTPGINGPTSKAAVKNADKNLKQLLDTLNALGLADSTDVVVTADHGFSTISKTSVNAQGSSTTSYAASLPFSGVNAGFLPKGFVAIDLAHALNLPLYDPDKAAVPITNGSGQYTLITPTAGQLTTSGNGLIGGTGAVTNGKTDAKVIVAANGGSDLIYVPDNNVDVAKQVVDFLTKQDYVSGVFVDTKTFGTIPGALSLQDIGLEGSAQTPVPSIIVNFTTFTTDASNPLLGGVEVADTGLQQGQGMHGSFSRADTFNNMAAIGPDFKKGYVDTAPISNADVAPTLAKILGLTLPSTGALKGRSLDEALVGGPQGVISKRGTLRSTDANGVQTILNYQQVGNVRYFDAAGFNNRTVGLVNSGRTIVQGTPGKDRLTGTLNNEAILGLSGNDLLLGDRHKNILIGGIGNDLEMGKDGNDTLDGGSGSNRLMGGRGRDIFVLAEPGRATVLDFKNRQDRLGLTGDLKFKDLTIRDRGRNTLVKHGARVLAILKDVEANEITKSDFTNVRYGTDVLTTINTIGKY
ncbi:MAG TPA: alkaline phosphatase family protein [Crinalium sp.]